MIITPEHWFAKADATLESARLLADNRHYSAASSHAYYVMFYAATALLLWRKLEFSKHSAVIAAFGQQFCKTGQIDPRFHTMVRKAQEARHNADYDAITQFDELIANQYLNQATEFLQMAKTFLASQDAGGSNT